MSAGKLLPCTATLVWHTSALVTAIFIHPSVNPNIACRRESHGAHCAIADSEMKRENASVHVQWEESF